MKSYAIALATLLTIFIFPLHSGKIELPIELPKNFKELPPKEQNIEITVYAAKTLFHQLEKMDAEMRNFEKKIGASHAKDDYDDFLPDIRKGAEGTLLIAKVHTLLVLIGTGVQARLTTFRNHPDFIEFQKNNNAKMLERVYETLLRKVISPYAIIFKTLSKQDKDFKNEKVICTIPQYLFLKYLGSNEEDWKRIIKIAETDGYKLKKDKNFQKLVINPLKEQLSNFENDPQKLLSTYEKGKTDDFLETSIVIFIDNKLIHKKTGTVIYQVPPIPVTPAIPSKYSSIPAVNKQ